MVWRLLFDLYKSTEGCDFRAFLLPFFLSSLPLKEEEPFPWSTQTARKLPAFRAVCFITIIVGSVFVDIDQSGSVVKGDGCFFGNHTVADPHRIVGVENA